MQAVFLGHQGIDVHAVCLQNKLSHMTVEDNTLSLLYGVSTTDNRSVSHHQLWQPFLDHEGKVLVS